MNLLKELQKLFPDFRVKHDKTHDSYYGSKELPSSEYRDSKKTLVKPLFKSVYVSGIMYKGRKDVRTFRYATVATHALTRPYRCRRINSDKEIDKIRVGGHTNQELLKSIKEGLKNIDIYVAKRH